MPRSLRVIAAIAAAATKPVAQSKFFESNLAGLRSILAVTFGGMTLDQLASFLRSHKLVVEVFHASASNVDRFREVARATLAEPKQFLIVNYDRKRIGQTVSGLHFACWRL